MAARMTAGSRHTRGTMSSTNESHFTVRRAHTTHLLPYPRERKVCGAAGLHLLSVAVPEPLCPPNDLQVASKPDSAFGNDTRMSSLGGVPLTGDPNGSLLRHGLLRNDTKMSFLGGIPLTGDPNGSFLQQGCSETTLKCRFLQQRWMPCPQGVVDEA